jgi:UPF0716 family protein affecting phage T7 exclusion
MDLFLLLIRIVVFALTLYLLLEFIVVCTVSTTVGIFITLGAAVIVVLGFIVLKRYDVITCQTCKQHMPKKLFNLPVPK